jgi:hypothetical protein
MSSNTIGMNIIPNKVPGSEFCKSAVQLSTGTQRVQIALAAPGLRQRYVITAVICTLTNVGAAITSAINFTLFGSVVNYLILQHVVNANQPSITWSEAQDPLFVCNVNDPITWESDIMPNGVEAMVNICGYVALI